VPESRCAVLPETQGANVLRSVAFKCTYNNGGEHPPVGFAGTCSLDNIARNVKDHRVWCSNQDCACKKFSDKGMKGELPVNPCQESVLFLDWKYGAGTFHHGKRAGKKIPLKGTGPGKFAILTTRFPGAKEMDRKIVGLFRIDEVESKNSVLSKSGGIRLPLEEAKELYFWAYCNNGAKKPDWRTGLFRYLEDGQVHRVLTDVAATVRDEKTQKDIDALIQNAFKGQEPPPAQGCLPQKSANRPVVIADLRKYGPGGEGKAHKELKEWIAKHPDTVQLSDVAKDEMEHLFLSGDKADIVFTHTSDASTVVEIETTAPDPGAHQAIKYRALLCAEKGLPLGAKNVTAILVAWSIPEAVRNFCNKYGILWHEFKLPNS
jgi:hypothetical protein